MNSVYNDAGLNIGRVPGRPLLISKVFFTRFCGLRNETHYLSYGTRYPVYFISEIKTARRVDPTQHVNPDPNSIPKPEPNRARTKGGWLRHVRIEHNKHLHIMWRRKVVGCCVVVVVAVVAVVAIVVVVV